jgi:D-sedoheptulose 7-phosphate isomerase
MNPDTKKHIIEAVEIHKKMTADFEKDGIETIAAIAEAIITALRQGGTVYLCGNGGSAADAQHIAGELVGRFTRERKPLAAVALSTDTSILTCIANDYSYEKVFARQAEALVRKGDILWAFSTSGTSANIVAAVGVAREKGAGIIAFTGRKGSKLEQFADICFCADAKSTARSQEIHQLAYHIICDLVERDFANG